MDSYLEHLPQELEDATGAASASGLAHAPAGKWNAAQILEHLLLTYKSTNRGLAKCLEGNSPLATRYGETALGDDGGCESRVSPWRAQSPGTGDAARNVVGRSRASHRA